MTEPANNQTQPPASPQPPATQPVLVSNPAETLTNQSPTGTKRAPDDTDLAWDVRLFKPRWRRFVLFYMASGVTGHLNATRAAKLAGYSPFSAHVTGYRLLRNPKIRAYMRAVLDGRVW